MKVVPKKETDRTAGSEGLKDDANRRISPRREKPTWQRSRGRGSKDDTIPSSWWKKMISFQWAMLWWKKLTPLQWATLIITIIGLVITAYGAGLICPKPDFSLKARPVVGEYAPGQEAQVTILVSNEGGYNEEVSLSANNPPPGITVHFDPLSVKPLPAFGSTARILIGPNVTEGSHSVSIIGTGQDGKQHEITIGLQVVHGGGGDTPPRPPGDSSQFKTLKTLDISDYYFPSGWMGDYQDITYKPVSTVVPALDKELSSIEIQYSARESNSKGWSGIYWQYPENNWGDNPSGYNLSGFSHLTFWARGQQGGERAEFKIGGITGSYPDSLQPVLSTGIQTLSTEWKQYSIDLSGKDLSHTIGGFVWVSSRNENPNGCIIFLTDIQLEK